MKIKFKKTAIKIRENRFSLSGNPSLSWKVGQDINFSSKHACEVRAGMPKDFGFLQP